MTNKYISPKQYWALKDSGKSVSVKSCHSRGWMLTIPADKMSFETLDSLLSKMATDDDNFAAKFSKERGDKTGYEHYQTFLYFKNKKTGSAVENIFPDVHIEPCRDIAASIKYVSKDETHIAGPFVYGIADQLAGMSTDADSVKRDLYDAAKDMILNHGYRFEDFVLDDNWRTWALTHEKVIQNLRRSFIAYDYSSKDRTVSVDYIYGPTGSGKSDVVLRMYGAKNVFIADLSSTFPFDGYDGEPVLLLDDYRSDFKFSDLLRILHGQPYPVNIKGGKTYACWTKVVITSNIYISDQYPNLTERRDPLYRCFEHGVVWFKKDIDDALPYASKSDAMAGIVSYGAKNGVPGWSRSAAVGRCDLTNYNDVQPKRSGDSDVDGGSYWDTSVSVLEPVSKSFGDVSKPSEQVYEPNDDSDFDSMFSDDSDDYDEFFERI